jgi:hypothetical protein
MVDVLTEKEHTHHRLQGRLLASLLQGVRARGLTPVTVGLAALASIGRHQRWAGSAMHVHMAAMQSAAD